MGNRLEKLKNLLLLSPGAPGIPGIPGVPYRPARTAQEPRTTTQTYRVARGQSVWVPPNPNSAGDTGHWAFVPDTSGTPLTGASIGTITVSTPVTELVYYPEQPAIPPRLPVPPTPAQWGANYNLGWNSGADSVLTYVGDMELSFQISAGTAGAVVGLTSLSSAVSTPFNTIDYAWRVSNGQAVVLEGGVVKTAAIATPAGSVFKVTRSGSTVTYSVGPTLVYTSLVASATYHLKVDSVLFAGGDAVVDAAVVGGLTGAAGTAKTGSMAGGFAPVTGIAADSATAVMRMSGSLAPMEGTARGDVYTFTPAFGVMFGAVAPPGIFVAGSIGRAGSMAGDFAPVTGIASAINFGRMQGSIAPVHGLALGPSLQRTSVESFGPEWESLITQASAGAVVTSYGPEWESVLTFPVPIESFGPEWVSNITAHETIIISVQSYGPVIALEQAYAYSYGPEWISEITQVETAQTAQAWWHNLMPDDGPETTRFTGGMAAFTRLARIGNTIYGMVQGGDIYPIGGTTDNGTAIAPVATTVNSQYGSKWSKRASFVYFGTADDVVVTPIVNGEAFTARQTKRGATGERMARIPAGLYGANWAFKIQPASGTALKLNNFTPRLTDLSVGNGS